MANERKSADVFEAALKRELQNASSSNAGDCPAPEILAAYYDRLLSRSERGRVDSHLTSCARCQSMMASIARADDSDPSLALEARGISWITRLLAPVAVVGVVIAIAIGVRTREQRAPEVIALTSPAGSYKPELAERAPAPPPEVAPEAPQKPTISNPPAAPNGESPAARIPKRQLHHAEKPAANSSPMRLEESVASAQPRNARAEVANETRPRAPVAASAPAAVAESPNSEEAAVSGVAKERARLLSASKSAAVPAQAPSNVRVQGSGSVAAMTEASSAASNAAGLSTFETSVTAAPTNQISSPDGSVLWRFGNDGAIFRSGNSSPWLAMHSGVTADLLAASAPSNDVCWMTGKSGTIVRTLDGGAHWQTLKPPSRDDFTTIGANDSNNATVIAANGKRFITHDGGVSWSSP